MNGTISTDGTQLMYFRATLEKDRLCLLRQCLVTPKDSWDESAECTATNQQLPSTSNTAASGERSLRDRHDSAVHDQAAPIQKSS